MNKLLPLLLALAFVGAGCAAAPNETTNNDQSNNGNEQQRVAENTVEIRDFAFGPAVLTVKKGTTVTWMNKDSVQHSVVGDNGKWQSSGLLSSGQTYQHTFDTVGTFTYHCGPHSYMKASVVVTE